MLQFQRCISFMFQVPVRERSSTDTTEPSPCSTDCRTEQGKDEHLDPRPEQRPRCSRVSTTEPRAQHPPHSFQGKALWEEGQPHFTDEDLRLGAADPPVLAVSARPAGGRQVGLP